MPTLALAAMDKLLRHAGAQRVSEDAKQAFREVLEEYANNVAKKSVELSKHGGRTTIKSSDIKLAAKH